MDNKAIIKFFDSVALNWDKGTPPERKSVEKIFSLGGITTDCDVLDVACGTGVLFPYYKEAKVKSVTAVDISSEMVKIAKSKGYDFNVLCADAHSFKNDVPVDCVMVFNCFPHFSNREALINNLAENLKTGGRLTIAHSMSEEALSEHHKNVPESVSSVLPCVESLSELLREKFNVDIAESNSEFYIVSAVKK